MIGWTICLSQYITGNVKQSEQARRWMKAFLALERFQCCSLFFFQWRDTLLFWWLIQEVHLCHCFSILSQVAPSLACFRSFPAQRYMIEMISLSSGSAEAWHSVESGLLGRETSKTCRAGGPRTRTEIHWSMLIMLLAFIIQGSTVREVNVRREQQGSISVIGEIKIIHFCNSYPGEFWLSHKPSMQWAR